jgi:hypothetical protein
MAGPFGIMERFQSETQEFHKDVYLLMVNLVS